DEPQSAIERVAAQQGAPLLARGQAFDAAVQPQPESESLAGQKIDYWEKSAQGTWTLDGIHLPFLGDHQAANAAAAMAALRQLTGRGFDIPYDAIRLGLSQTRCHARIELIRRRPNVIADVAHNVASVQALVEVVRREFPTGKRILLFASSRDKDIPGMLRLLLPEFDQIVLTRFVTNPRGVEVEELHSLARETLSDSCREPPAFAVERDPVAAWQLAQRLAQDDDLICITGSFFLAAELLPLVRDGGNTHRR
ncbi:MAG: cyanophycin synthetase, partial [Pirellulaceae bacterium]